MELGFLFILLGAGAIFAFGDAFSSSNADQPDDDDDTQPIRRGTNDSDLMVSPGGETLMGFRGDDRLITFGDSTLMGGRGDDTLISFGGGAVLNGGPGEDTFIINLLNVSEDGDLLDMNGQPVTPTVIDDFNPDEDRLAIDLSLSGLLPADGAPVVLTGIVAPDGEGLMVQVNGVNVVQLSSYGGANAQAALENLYTDFGALEVTGADFVFPDGSGDSPVIPPEAPSPDPVVLPGTLIGPGLSVGGDIADNMIFYMSAEYSGDDYFPAGEGFDQLNLTFDTRNLDVTVDASGAITVTSAQDPALGPVFWQVESVILGDGANTFNAADATGVLSAISQGGENTLIGGQGTNFLTSLGGNAVIQGGSGINYLSAANGNDTIIGGTGPNVIAAFNDGFVGVNAPDGTPIWLADVPGFTTITDGPGDDRISAGRGDQITLTGGANRIEITGYSPADFGPTLIFGFDPETDSFEYRVAIGEFESDYGTETPAPRDVTLEQRGNDVVLLQSGIEMVRFADLTLAEIAEMQDGQFIQQGDPNMGMFRFDAAPIPPALPTDPGASDGPEPAALTFVITDDFVSQGAFSGPAGQANVLDFSQFTRAAFITDYDPDDRDDINPVYLYVADVGEYRSSSVVVQSVLDRTLIENVQSVVAGPGELRISQEFGSVAFSAKQGNNIVSIDRGTIQANLEGGTNRLSVGGFMAVSVLGGENSIFFDEEANGGVIFQENATGTTIIKNGLQNSADFQALGSDIAITLTDEGAVAAWGSGSAQVNAGGYPYVLRVADGTTIDASALGRDEDDWRYHEVRIATGGPNTTIIGGDTPRIVLI